MNFFGLLLHTGPKVESGCRFSQEGADFTPTKSQDFVKNVSMRHVVKTFLDVLT